MPSTIATGVLTAVASSRCARACWATATALYTVALDDTNHNLHTYKSTDGASWSEQDSANVPSVISSTPPYDTFLHTDGYIYILRMPSAGTLRVRRFNTATNTWETTDSPNSDAQTTSISPSNVAITVRSDGDIVVAYTAASAIRYRRWDGAAWNTETTLEAVTGNIQDIVVGAGDISYFYWKNTAGNDETTVSLTSADSLGTVTDLDAAVHTTANLMNYQAVTWNDGTNNKVAGLSRDTTGEIDFYHATQGATPTYSTVSGVSTSLVPANTNVGMAAFNNQIWVCWSVANNIVYDKTPSLATLTFNATDTTLISSLTDADPAPQFIQGLGGLGCVYNDNGAVKVEWIITPTPAGKPVIVTSSFSNSAAVTANTNIPITRPADWTPAANDYLILALNDRATAESTFAVSGGTGTWVRLKHGWAAGATAPTTDLWGMRVVTPGSEPTSYNYQFNQSAASCALLAIVRNVDTTTALDTASPAAATGTSATSTATSGTPTANDELSVFVSGWDASTSTTLTTPPAGYNAYKANSSNARALLYAKYLATPSAQAPAEVFSGSDDWVALLAFLNPPAVAATSLPPVRRQNVLVRR